MFLSSYRNTCESLGEKEMLFQALLNYQECFDNLIETLRTCFLFRLEDTVMQKKKINLFTWMVKM